MIKSYFLTITQYENLGDLVINKMLIEEISRYSEVYLDRGSYSNAFIDELKSVDCKDVYTTYGLSLHTPSCIYKTLRFIKREGIKCFFVSPGPKSIGSLFSIRILVLLFIYFWCRLNGIKAYYVGVDLRTTTKSNRIYNSLLSICLEKIYLRDNIILKEFKKPNIEYIPDLSLLYNNKVKSFLKEKLILMSFRKFEGIEHNQKFEHYLDSVVKYYIDKNYRIKFFYQVERDKKYNEYLYSKYIDNKNISMCDSLIWYKDMDLLYSSSSVVVSNRMHVLLFGLIYKSNIIAMLGNQPSTKKITYVFKSIGIDHTIYDINEKSFNGLNLELSDNDLKKIVREQCCIIEDTIRRIFKNNN